MKKYEGMFLIDSETALKKRDEVIAHIRDTVQKHQGEVLDLDKWEDLKLAYEIKKHRKGAYFLGHFTIPPGEVNNIRDEFLISDMVLRHMFIIDTGRTQFLEDDSDYGAPKPARREPRTAQAAPKETAPKEAAPKEAAPEGIAPEEAAPKEPASEEITPKEAAPEEMISKEESPDTAKDTTLEAPEKAEEPAEEEKTEAPEGAERGINPRPERAAPTGPPKADSDHRQARKSEWRI